MKSAVVLCTPAAIPARAVDTERERRFMVGAALLLSCAIGSSRIVLGVHWPSDVPAGWAIGGAWAALVTMAAAAPAARRRRSAAMGENLATAADY